MCILYAQGTASAVISYGKTSGPGTACYIDLTPGLCLVTLSPYEGTADGLADIGCPARLESYCNTKPRTMIVGSMWGYNGPISSPINYELPSAFAIVATNCSDPMLQSTVNYTSTDETIAPGNEACDSNIYHLMADIAAAFTEASTDGSYMTFIDVVPSLVAFTRTKIQTSGLELVFSPAISKVTDQEYLSLYQPVIIFGCEYIEHLSGCPERDALNVTFTKDVTIPTNYIKPQYGNTADQYQLESQRAGLIFINQLTLVYGEEVWCTCGGKGDHTERKITKNQLKIKILDSKGGYLQNNCCEQCILQLDAQIEANNCCDKNKNTSYCPLPAENYPYCPGYDPNFSQIITANNGWCNGSHFAASPPQVPPPPPPTQAPTATPCRTVCDEYGCTDCSFNHDGGCVTDGVGGVICSGRKRN